MTNGCDYIDDSIDQRRRTIIEIDGVLSSEDRPVFLGDHRVLHSVFAHSRAIDDCWVR